MIPGSRVRTRLLTHIHFIFSFEKFCLAVMSGVKATFHLTISMCGQRAITGKTSLVSLIFTHRTHRNVKNR